MAVSVDHRRPGRWVNEFLLQYPDGPSAHRALLDAWHQANGCAPSDTAVDRSRLDGGRTGGLSKAANRGKAYDGGFWARRPHDDLGPLELRLVARAGHVLVVVEGTVWKDDARVSFLLQQAVEQALPHYVSGG